MAKSLVKGGQSGKKEIQGNGKIRIQGVENAQKSCDVILFLR
jgi:hypothetical protein